MTILADQQFWWLKMQKCNYFQWVVNLIHRTCGIVNRFPWISMRFLISWQATMKNSMPLSVNLSGSAAATATWRHAAGITTTPMDHWLLMLIDDSWWMIIDKRVLMHISYYWLILMNHLYVHTIDTYWYLWVLINTKWVCWLILLIPMKITYYIILLICYYWFVTIDLLLLICCYCFVTIYWYLLTYCDLLWPIVTYWSLMLVTIATKAQLLRIAILGQLTRCVALVGVVQQWNQLSLWRKATVIHHEGNQ